MGEVSCRVKKFKFGDLPYWPDAIVEWNSSLLPNTWHEVLDDQMNAATFEQFVTGEAKQGRELVLKTPHITHIRLRRSNEKPPTSEGRGLAAHGAKG